MAHQAGQERIGRRLDDGDGIAPVRRRSLEGLEKPDPEHKNQEGSCGSGRQTQDQKHSGHGQHPRLRSSWSRFMVGCRLAIPGLLGEKLFEQPGAAARPGHGQERDIPLDLSEVPLPVAAGAAGGQVSAQVGRDGARLLAAHQTALHEVAVHASCRSSSGARIFISFCRALKTRQRAVSSLMPSTAPIA